MGRRLVWENLLDSEEAQSESTGPVKLSHPKLVLDVDFKLQEVSNTLVVIFNYLISHCSEDLGQDGHSMGSGTCEFRRLLVR